MKGKRKMRRIREGISSETHDEITFHSDQGILIIKQKGGKKGEGEEEDEGFQNTHHYNLLVGFPPNPMHHVLRQKFRRTCEPR